MHACGHDTHVAMLAYAAAIRCARQDDLRGRIIFMFQPGAEGQGGAALMIDEGVMDGGVDLAFAIHATANVPAGHVETRGGTLMASADAVHLTVVGRGGHASQPHRANDPIPTACEIVLALRLW
jgi:hippurate hydrolase